jgi:DNA-directed RNA polymerase subunit M/transcription elongation factor TFIIS
MSTKLPTLCPKCDNLLIPRQSQKDDNLMLKCETCTWEVSIPNDIPVPISNISNETKSNFIEYGLNEFFPTNIIESRICERVMGECKNKDCKGKVFVRKRGKDTLDLCYICHTCKTLWYQNDK